MKACLFLALFIFSSFHCFSQDQKIKAIEQTVDSIKNMNLLVEKTFKIPAKPDSSEFMNVFYFANAEGVLCKIEQELKEKGEYVINHYYLQNNELIKIESSSSKENFASQHENY